MLVTDRLTLSPIHPAEALRIVSGTPGPNDHWHAEYPLEDELAISSGARQVNAATTPDNVASQRVLLKAGYRETARSDGAIFYSFRFLPDSSSINGAP